MARREHALEEAPLHAQGVGSEHELSAALLKVDSDLSSRRVVYECRVDAWTVIAIAVADAAAIIPRPTAPTLADAFEAATSKPPATNSRL